MSDKIEGTLTLDGLLEGKLPSAEAEGRVRQWVGFAASLGLRFSLEVEGAAFSLLADNQPIQAAALGGTPSKVVADALGELLKVFPPEARRSLFSTLRSVEYRPRLEVQTLYVVSPEGAVDVREQASPAETTPPPQPLTTGQKLRRGAIGLGVAVLVLAVSALFIDYRALLTNVLDSIRPIDPETFDLDASAFEDYFTIEKKAVRGGGRRLVLTVKRTDAFPTTDEALDAAMVNAGGSLRARLVLESIARGYVRCEYFGRKDEFLQFTLARIRGLREKESIELALPIPSDRRPARIVMTY